MKYWSLFVMLTVLGSIFGCSSAPAQHDESVLVQFLGGTPVTGVSLGENRVLTVAHALPERKVGSGVLINGVFMKNSIVSQGGEFDYAMPPGSGSVENDWIVIHVPSSLQAGPRDFTSQLPEGLQVEVIKSIPGELPGMAPRQEVLSSTIQVPPPGWKVAPGIYIYGVFKESKEGFSGSPVKAEIGGKQVTIGMAIGETLAKTSDGAVVYLPFFIRPNISP